MADLMVTIQEKEQMMKSFARRMPAALALAAMLIVETHCGAPLEKDTSVAEQPSTPKRGGTLTVAIGNDVQNFNPITSLTQVYRANVQKAVFNMLFQYDEHGELVPMLATQVDQPESATYVFTLREGVRWHDGKPFTAADVKYTYDQIRDPQHGSPYLPFFETVESVEISHDEKRVTVKLSEPYSAFMDAVAFAAIVQEGSGEANTLNPIGTGPFKFLSWTANDKGIFEANPDYFLGAPLLDRLVIKVQPDIQVSLANLRAGEIDAISQFPANLVAAVASDPGIQLLVQEEPTLLMFIELRSDKAYTRTTSLRRALAQCIDHQAVKRIVFSGFGKPTSNFLHRSSPYWSELPVYGYDPDAAKRVFETELPADVEPLIIEVPAGWPALEQLAVIWQAGLTRAGVISEIRIGEIQVWLERTLGPEFTVTTNGYGPSPEPNTWFQIVPRRHWYSYASEDEPGDYTTDEAKRMERLVNEALRAVDEETRRARWREAIELHHAELPAIPVFYWPLFVTTRTGVHDITISPTSDLHYARAWVDG